jgi:hypothetical protein
MTPCSLVGDHQTRNILHSFQNTVTLTVFLYITDDLKVGKTNKFSRWKPIEIFIQDLGLIRVSLVLRKKKYVNNLH